LRGLEEQKVIHNEASIQLYAVAMLSHPENRGWITYKAVSSKAMEVPKPEVPRSAFQGFGG